MHGWIEILCEVATLKLDLKNIVYSMKSFKLVKHMRHIYYCVKNVMYFYQIFKKYVTDNVDFCRFELTNVH